MRKIKVMHLIHQLGAGGAENGIINIVNHIDPERIESAICAFVGGGSQEKRVDTKRTLLVNLGKKPGNDIGLPFRLRTLLKNWRPDILHTHAWGTLCEGVAGAKLAGVSKVIHGEHGTIQEKPLNLFVQRMVWSITNQVLSVSDAHKARLSKTIGFPIEKIRVIRNGVDTTRFSPVTERVSLKKSLGYEKEDVVVGTVGRLMPVKNQALLIRGFASALNEIPHLKLMLVGNGPLEKTLKKLAGDLGIEDLVCFAGRRSDIPEVLNAMDIFVLPSLSEGMSNTILEAMSCALPVIATDVGGNPGIVKQGKTGLLVPSEDSGAMAQAIYKMGRALEIRDRYGQAGRRVVEAEYSLKRMVEEYEHLYQEIYASRAT